VKEIEWRGNVAFLDVPSNDSKILAYRTVEWTQVPMTLWHQDRPVGVVKAISLHDTLIYAQGTIADGQLIGEMLRGKKIPVSPNVKQVGKKQMITALTVVRDAPWPGVGIVSPKQDWVIGLRKKR